MYEITVFDANSSWSDPKVIDKISNLTLKQANEVEHKYQNSGNYVIVEKMD